MEHLALYRKYRPRTFEDVCGQEHITSVLSYESAHGRLSHAYLFCGPRGTGKTTCAKILSKAVNCDSPVNGDPCGKCFRCRAIDEGSATDVVEMDAASNTGVEYIRDIRDEVTYTPAMMKKRVYIIDEVHMLSMGAFNALLKTLEEPPEHVVFILATTEQHKLPATIISRCQRFDFRRITIEDIAARLTYIADKEGIPLEAEAARLLSRQAQGGMRDAINLLELCAGGGHGVTAERVRTVLGITGLENAYRTAVAVKNGDFDALFASVADVVSSSKDISVFWDELVSFWRDMLVAKSTKNMADYLDLTAPDAALVADAAKRFTTAELIYHSGLLDETMVNMKKLPQIKRNFAECALVKMASPDMLVTTDALLARIAALEDKVRLVGCSPTGNTPAISPTVPTEAARPAESEQTAPPVQTSPRAEAVPTEQRRVTPAPSPTQSPRPDTRETPTVPPSPAPKAESKWRRITDKSEFTERVRAANPSICGFLNTAELFVSSDRSKILVKVQNPFALSMLSKPDSKSTVADALLLSGDAEVGCDVKVELGAAVQSAPSLMDELSEL